MMLEQSADSTMQCQSPGSDRPALLTAAALRVAELGVLPDSVIRAGIRRLLRQRLRQLTCSQASSQAAVASTDDCGNAPIAVATEMANSQHYEVPADFFRLVLGRQLKYSCGLWINAADTLDESEVAALRQTCRNAQIQDGQAILELGCGWGSLSLWMAEHFPGCHITAVSNSGSQREFIERQAAERGFRNLRVITCDINHFLPDRVFDRVVSVEMFEHCRNHELLLQRISTWLKPAGKLLVHHFCHRSHGYLFEDSGSADWMTRNFFSGGMMPSRNMLGQFDRHMVVEYTNDWPGGHYQKTSNAWLRKMDSCADLIRPVLKDCYGDQWRVWRQRWRMFFMACAELFAFNGGQDWYVTQVRMIPRYGGATDACITD